MSTSMSAGIGKIPCFTTFQLFLCSHFSLILKFLLLVFSFHLFIYFLIFYNIIMVTGTTLTTIKERMVPNNFCT